MFLLLCITFYLESLTSAVSIKKALFLETLENIYIYIIDFPILCSTFVQSSKNLCFCLKKRKVIKLTL